MGDAVQWMLAIAGGVISAVQAWKWITGRRAERGLAKLLESYADSEDADLRRAELSKLQEAVEQLQRSAPDVARRLHIDQRRTDLAISIGSEVEEFARLGRQLKENDPLGDLNDDAAAIIRTEILPLYASKVKQDRLVRSLLMVIVLLLVLPLPVAPSELLLVVPYLVIAPEATYPWGSVVASVLGLAAGAALSYWATRRYSRGNWPRLWWLSVWSGALLLVIGNAAAVFLAIDYGREEYEATVSRGDTVGNLFVFALAGAIVLVGSRIHRPPRLRPRAAPANGPPVRGATA